MTDTTKSWEPIKGERHLIIDWLQWSETFDEDRAALTLRFLEWQRREIDRLNLKVAKLEDEETRQHEANIRLQRRAIEYRELAEINLSELEQQALTSKNGPTLTMEKLREAHALLMRPI